MSARLRGSTVRYLILTLVCALLCACDLPHSTVRTGSPSPSLIVVGAPANSVLYVDGVSMGVATTFDGKPNTLAVLEGVHTVEIREGSQVVYSEKAFVSSGETHTVSVSVGGGPQ
jgi:hypothetical protein